MLMCPFALYMVCGYDCVLHVHLKCNILMLLMLSPWGLSPLDWSCEMFSPVKQSKTLLHVGFNPRLQTTLSKPICSSQTSGVPGKLAWDTSQCHDIQRNPEPSQSWAHSEVLQTEDSLRQTRGAFLCPDSVTDLLGYYLDTMMVSGTE